MIEQIISLIAPYQCLGCQKEGFLLCPICCETLPSGPPHCYKCGSLSCKTCQATLKNTFVATVYDGLAKELIHKLKFERARRGADVMAGILARRMPPIGEAIVSFVPTATSRVRIRGYDQAALVARRLATLRGGAYAPLLYRVGQQRQVGKTKAVRREQLKGSFLVKASDRVAGQHIVLVDDVLTTGATLEIAAAALYRAGARRVDAAVFASVLPN
jgi:ComF family protein